MKIFYFNISNGKCVVPFTALPEYRAFLSGKKVMRIESCFSVPNIASRGYEWFLSEAKKDNEMWSRTHPHLMKSLKELISKEYRKMIFKHTNFVSDCHRYPYVLTWDADMEYADSHFIKRVK